MSRVRELLLLAFALCIVTIGGGLHGSASEPEGGYGDTYTDEELRALDRALHAANMTRQDLAFRKDMTKGRACLRSVRDMLQEPLRIAPFMDRCAGWTRSRDDGRLLPLLVLSALDLATDEGAKRDTSPTAPAWASQPDVGAPESLVVLLQELLRSSAETLGQELDTDLERAALRHHLPEQMAWHEVFESPYEAEEVKRIEEFLEGKTDSWLHDTAAKLRLDHGVRAWIEAFGTAPEAWGRLGAEAFPEDAPLVVDTPEGRIALGTPGDDVYEGDFAVLIEPGGDDRYVGCRIGAADLGRARPVGLFVDLGGHDLYECGDVNVTLGAAILGIAAFYDLGQGNDRYVGGHASLGAAMGGVAVFYDDGGSDVYEARTYTQGAAGFGIGIFFDDARGEPLDVPTDKETPDPIDIARLDNDRLHAWSNAQAFARCRGVALCVNRRGNDIYEAGGVYLHAPLFSDRYQSFSQGFAIGQRGIDYAGGIAMLIDHDGNDRYLGDVYNQGVGYWYSAGLVWDGGGNDTYEMTQYGQGSGIHLAVGGLVDVAGHDTYVMHSGLGQGGSHDYAASILHDRAGNDRYLGNTSCNGAALTNSVGLHFDRAGNDLYAGKRKGAINFGRPARGFSSIGVLLDLAGTDDYLGTMGDDSLWRHTDIGVGWDTQPEPLQTVEEGVTPAADQVQGKAEVPTVCSYEGDLTEEVFDELWAIAVRWQVGDNRYIVPKARERLVAFGPDVLPLLDGKVEESASGLELRAYQDVLEGLNKAGASEQVVAFLRRNLEHETERRKRVALYLAGEMKVKALEQGVVAVLRSENEALARRAPGVLRRIGSHAGDETLLSWLDPRGDERAIQAALGTLLGLEGDVYDHVRPLLDHPLLSVRTRLVALLVERSGAYGDRVKADLVAGDLSTRARRTILDVLVRLVPAPDDILVAGARVLLEHDDWGMRADVVRLIRRWEADEAIPRDMLAPVLKRLDEVLATEKDPYVLFCARQVAE